jgi:hypothetical protein
LVIASAAANSTLRVASDPPTVSVRAMAVSSPSNTAKLWGSPSRFRQVTR